LPLVGRVSAGYAGRRGGVNRLAPGHTGVCPTRPAGVLPAPTPASPPPIPPRTGRSISINTYRVGLRPIPLMCPILPSSKYNRTSALHNIRQLQPVRRLDDTVTPRNSNAYRPHRPFARKATPQTPTPFFADVMIKHSPQAHAHIYSLHGEPNAPYIIRGYQPIRFNLEIVRKARFWINAE
jgi:hypothetical protein